MKKKLRTLLRQFRKEKAKKKFTVEETGEKKWQLVIKSPNGENLSVELNFDDLAELGYEVGMAQLDYEHKVLYNDYYKKGEDNHATGGRVGGINAGNNGRESSPAQCWLLCAGKKFAGIFTKKGK
jgi:hypothetical protein